MLKNNIKIYLIYFYLVLPFIFYFPIYIYTLINDFEYTIHFYSNVIIDSNSSLRILLAHMLSGAFILLIPNYRCHFSLSKGGLTDYAAISLFLLVMFFVTQSYLVYVATILLFITISRLGPGYWLIFLLVIAVAMLIFNGQRYLIVWFALYSAIHLLRMNLLRLLISSGLGLIVFATLLQGLKNFGEGLSIFNIFDLDQLFIEVYNNISPTYLVSYLYLDRTYSVNTVLGEIIPFLKLFTGERGLVDTVSYDFLPSELIDDGSRLGSSTSILLSDSAIFIISIISIFVVIIRSLCQKFIFFNQAIIFYLVLYAPYSVRRSITSFAFDFIFLLVFCLIIVAIKKLLKYIILSNQILMSSKIVPHFPGGSPGQG
jgi:hypothetical protein